MSAFEFIVVALMVAIVASLGQALWAMTTHKGDSANTDLVKALSWRIGLSAGLFVFLLAALAAGWV